MKIVFEKTPDTKPYDNKTRDKKKHEK